MTREELDKRREEYDKAQFENTTLTNADVEKCIKKIVQSYETKYAEYGRKLTYKKREHFEDGIKEAIIYFFEKSKE